MALTWHELGIKYPEYREEMEVDREREFVNDCFDTYETYEKLANTFWTPFSSYEDKIGMTFSVIGREDELNCDLETLPMWRIKLEDGTKFDAYPEEIYEREQVENGRDKQ